MSFPVTLLGEDRLSITLPMGGTQSLVIVRDGRGRVTDLHQGMRALARQPESAR
jgi:hypothetical protein